LVEQTSSGKLDWKETAGRDVFQVSFPNYSILLSEEKTQRGSSPDYVISIKNSNGTTIDSFSDVTLGQETNESYFEKMRELYTAARRKALGSTKP
jgi:hypothetical protein